MNYKEILKGIVNIINTTEKSDIGFANICSYIGENCPELKESEDEREMKRIIGLLEGWLSTFKETCYAEDCKCGIDWLRSLKNRVQPRPIIEWGEEDELNLKGIIDEIEANKSNAPSYDIKTYDRFLNWLKSLKDRIGG